MMKPQMKDVKKLVATHTKTMMSNVLDMELDCSFKDVIKLYELETDVDWKKIFKAEDRSIPEMLNVIPTVLLAREIKQTLVTKVIMHLIGDFAREGTVTLPRGKFIQALNCVTEGLWEALDKELQASN